MSGKTSGGDALRKRKHDGNTGTSTKSEKSRKAPKIANGNDAQSEILSLEEQVLKSEEHYDNILKLQEKVPKFEKRPETATLAAVALCRIFCRLIAGGNLVITKSAADADVSRAKWLKDRLKEYVDSLIDWLGTPDAAQESTALTLLLRIVKAEASQGRRRAEASWRNMNGAFCRTVKALLDKSDAESTRQEFVDNFMEEYDDVRFYTFLVVKEHLSDEANRSHEKASNAIDLLTRVEGVPSSEDDLKDWFGDSPLPDNKQIRSLNAHRKMAQDAWLAVFRSSPTSEQRKAILDALNAQILPWFSTRIELIVDFLTDSFDQGGSLSILALSGIFYLMAEKNLDYPDFYAKLYSLLDHSAMQSKHRSRFFRLLEKFMGSSHLPAAMVASFIKRLARLSLQAPPGAIVFIVPWTYNMLKQHPACTFMVHRSYHPAHAIYAQNPNYLEEGMQDPFDMKQPDPMLTGAIDSSLWELETLQSHYHPNVATLAKIIGEQFTKREYQLEDFLDHSYAALIDAELDKSMKKEPVVEWEIPKRIITASDEVNDLNALGNALRGAIEAIQA